MGCPLGSHSVEVVGAEEYGLFLDSVPQLPARPLSDRYACWQERCVLLSWLDNTLRWDHPIQFKRLPPPFKGLMETRLRDPAASPALAAEVARLLKGTITTFLLHESHLGFYSHYLLVSKKSAEKRPILDLGVQQICCHKEIQNAHYQSAAPMCERATASHPWISRMLTSTSLFGRRTGSFSRMGQAYAYNNRTRVIIS